MEQGIYQEIFEDTAIDTFSQEMDSIITPLDYPLENDFAENVSDVYMENGSAYGNIYNFSSLSESSQSNDCFDLDIDDVINFMHDDYDEDEVSAISIQTIGDINTRQYINCFSEKIRDMFCVNTTLAMVRRWLPMPIYFKYGKNERREYTPYQKNNNHYINMTNDQGKNILDGHKCLGFITHINVKDVSKTGYKRSYRYMFSIKPLKIYEHIFKENVSLSNAARLAREYFVGDGRDVKLNGWRIFKYRTQNGAFKSLLNLFTSDMRRGLTLPTCIKAANKRKRNIMSSDFLEDETIYTLRLPMLSLCPKVMNQTIDEEYYKNHLDFVNEYKDAIFN